MTPCLRTVKEKNSTIQSTVHLLALFELHINIEQYQFNDAYIKGSSTPSTTKQNQNN